MNSTPERLLTELRIARAYVKLSSVPEDGSKPSVSLAYIGNCEIRMFRGPEADLDGMTLFWLELFDNVTKNVCRQLPMPKDQRRHGCIRRFHVAGSLFGQTRTRRRGNAGLNEFYAYVAEEHLMSETHSSRMALFIAGSRRSINGSGARR
jgi:hypothetical protein